MVGISMRSFQPREGGCFFQAEVFKYTLNRKAGVPPCCFQYSDVCGAGSRTNRKNQADAFSACRTLQNCQGGQYQIKFLRVNRYGGKSLEGGSLSLKKTIFKFWVESHRTNGLFLLCAGERDEMALSQIHVVERDESQPKSYHTENDGRQGPSRQRVNQGSCTKEGL